MINQIRVFYKTLVPWNSGITIKNMNLMLTIGQKLLEKKKFKSLLELEHYKAGIIISDVDSGIDTLVAIS